MSPAAPAHVAAPAPARPLDLGYGDGARRSPPQQQHGGGYASHHSGYDSRDFVDRSPSPAYHAQHDDDRRRVSRSPPRWASAGEPSRRYSPGPSRAAALDDLPPQHLDRTYESGDYDAPVTYHSYRTDWENGSVGPNDGAEAFYHDQEPRPSSRTRRSRTSHYKEDLVTGNPAKRKKKGNEDADYQPGRRVSLSLHRSWMHYH